MAYTTPYRIAAIAVNHTTSNYADRQRVFVLPSGFPLTYQLPDDALPKQAWGKISHIRTVSIERLIDYAATITPEDLEEIIDGLSEIIGT